MGAVYKACQYILNRIVALKVMPPRAADGGSISFHRFKREARLLATIESSECSCRLRFRIGGQFPLFHNGFCGWTKLAPDAEIRAIESF